MRENKALLESVIKNNVGITGLDDETHFKELWLIYNKRKSFKIKVLPAMKN